MRTSALPIFHFKALYRYLRVLKTSFFGSFIVLFLAMLLVQVQYFWTGTRYDLEVLRLCGKKLKTKNLKYFGTNSNICRSYRRKTAYGGHFVPILNRLNRQERNIHMINAAKIFLNLTLSIR